MIEIIIFLFIAAVIAMFRVSKAGTRLQSCIDNGKVKFDGVHIELSESLTDSEIVKLTKERDLYIKARRAFKTFPEALHKRNSIY